MKYMYILLALALFFKCTDSKKQGSEVQPIKVEIRKEGEAYKLFRGGEPYTFNGAGLAGYVENFKAHGGNSFRTWSVDNEMYTGQEVLDKAFENGMTVTMCFYVRPERHDMDYNNAEMVSEQFDRIKEQVMKYKDHPALLMWCIGNELNLSYSNPKVYDAVNDISEWIHEVDPNHPTTTTVASLNPELANVIKERAPDLDLLSVQVYGDLFVLQDLIQESEWEKPYMVTEWGSIGHWEMESTEWGAPIEQTSTEKANTYLRGYKKSIEPYLDQCIGNYVFLWGQKQERTPTWYGMFLPSGEETETIDVMHYIWNNEWPENRAPQVDSLALDGRESRDNIYLKPGKAYTAEAYLVDPDQDSIQYYWEVLHESTATEEGGDYEERPAALTGLFSDQSDTPKFTAPEEEGAYRLFLYAYDGQGNGAHANIPFYVRKQ